MFVQFNMDNPLNINMLTSVGRQHHLGSLVKFLLGQWITFLRCPNDNKYSYIPQPTAFARMQVYYLPYVEESQDKWLFLFESLEKAVAFDCPHKYALLT